jgi:CubicO group peptidase (beta-lactamase class C family)
MPASLSSIADVGTESDVIRPEQKRAIWRAMKHFYRAGMNPAISLAIRHRGELVFNRALGYANVETGSRLSVTAPVCLFSASKAVTATLIHSLVEDGLLQLDSRVAEYLPEFGCNGKESTTLLDLLAHRAGIPRIPDASPELMFDKGEGTRRLCAAKPETPVGTRQAYHAITAGYILGEVAERVTGKTLNELLDKKLRRPLGMTYFRYGLEPDDRALVPQHYLTGLRSRLLDSYFERAVGAKLKDAIDVSNDPRFMETVVPAGNLYATAEETTRFYQMLLDGGRWHNKQLLQEDTLHRALCPVSAPFVIDGSLLLPIRFSAGFMLGARVVSLFGPGTEKAFGHLGFVSVTTWADPARQLSVALLTTGKGLIGPQLPAMLQLFGRINRLR